MKRSGCPVCIERAKSIVRGVIIPDDAVRVDFCRCHTTPLTVDCSEAASTKWGGPALVAEELRRGRQSEKTSSLNPDSLARVGRLRLRARLWPICLARSGDSNNPSQ